MSGPNPTLEAVLAGFAKKPGVTAEQQAQLRTAITQDPHLLDQLNQAVTSGQLRGFERAVSNAHNLLGTSLSPQEPLL